MNKITIATILSMFLLACEQTAKMPRDHYQVNEFGQYDFLNDPNLSDSFGNKSNSEDYFLPEAMMQDTFGYYRYRERDGSMQEVRDSAWSIESIAIARGVDKDSIQHFSKIEIDSRNLKRYTFLLDYFHKPVLYNYYFNSKVYRFVYAPFSIWERFTIITIINRNDSSFVEIDEGFLDFNKYDYRCYCIERTDTSLYKIMRMSTEIQISNDAFNFLDSLIYASNINSVKRTTNALPQDNGSQGFLMEIHNKEGYSFIVRYDWPDSTTAEWQILNTVAKVAGH